MSATTGFLALLYLLAGLLQFANYAFEKSTGEHEGLSYTTLALCALPCWPVFVLLAIVPTRHTRRWPPRLAALASVD